MKRALITGASEGIGREFARSLAQQGYAVVAVARNEKRLLELLQELGGSDHSHLVADLSNKEDVQKVTRLLQSQKFDLVINNAGIGIYGPFEQADLRRLETMVQLNCSAVIEVAHAFLKTARSGDALINVSSTASRLPMPITSVYAASKAFVTGFSESVWYEQRSKGVYVLCLCPGMTATRFHSRAGGEDGQIPAWFSQTPQQVVAIALRALRRRKSPIVICGPQRPLIFLSRFLPRKWVILLAGKALEWAMTQ